MNKEIVVIQGSEVLKTVVDERGERQRIVVPFIGINDVDYLLPAMGIGVKVPEERASIFWVMDIGYPFVRLWRSVEILKELNTVSQEILEMCFNLAGGKVFYTSFEFDKATELSRYGEEFYRVLDSILRQVPTCEEFNTASSVLRSCGMAISAHELELELARGHLSQRSFDAINKD